MEMYDSLFSSECMLNEQIARQIFEILPEEGPIMVIMDRNGNCWPSNSEKFSNLNLSESFLQDLCSKIDDGSEPIVTQVEDVSIIGAQIYTENSNCGYVVVILPKYNPESTLINIDLIEVLINQTNLIAKLVEKNNQLHEHQIKQMSVYRQGQESSN